jgi:hypothetical protein
VTQAKVMWDNILYFMFPALLYLQGYNEDHEFVAKVRDTFMPHHKMNIYMQKCFLELCRDDCDVRDAGFAVASDYMVEELFLAGNSQLTQDEVADLIAMNIRRLKDWGEETLERLYGACGKPIPEKPAEFDQVEGGTGEHLLNWSPYEQKTGAPAAHTPQPEDAYLIR